MVFLKSFLRLSWYLNRTRFLFNDILLKIKTNLKFSFIRQNSSELGSVRKPLGTSKHIGYMLTSKSVYYTADLWFFSKFKKWLSFFWTKRIYRCIAKWEREKGFFSISEQHEISLVRCAMVGSQKSRSCLGAELVSQLSKFLKNRGSTRNSNHSTKSFVFSSQNISEHLTTSWYISFVLFRFFFNLFEVERQIGVLKSIIASKFYEIRWSLDFFFGHIFTHSLSCLC